MDEELLTIPEILHYRSEHEPDKKSFTFYNKHGFVSCLTPRDLYTLSGKFARCLQNWGFQAGDVIANGLPNSPERLITDFGIIQSGCVLTNMQVVEKDGSDFWHSAKISNCRGVIVPNRKEHSTFRLISPFLLEDSNKFGIYDVNIPKAANTKKVILIDRQTNGDSASLIDYLKNCCCEPLQTQCSPNDIALLFGTSGSSGFSKLIPQTHENILKAGRRFKQADTVVYYTDRPTGWIGGFPFEFLTSSARRVSQDKFDNLQAESPDDLWNAITECKCTGAALLPSDAYELVNHFRNNPPDYKVYFISSGGQAMKKELMEVLGLITHAIVVSYGSSEGGAFAVDGITDPAQFKDFYCGKVMSDVEVKIVDEEENDVGFDKEGEIYLKSPNIIKNYYNASNEITVPTLAEMYTADGWYRTGDRGTLKSDKALYCFGRKGDVVSIGSFLVYLSWPENILNKCPMIQNCVVVGIEEEDLGEEEEAVKMELQRLSSVSSTRSNSSSHCEYPKLIACVVPKAGHEEVNESDIVSYFKVALSETETEFTMQLSHAFIFDKLPLLPSGKVNKRCLKRIVIEKLKVSV